MVTVSMTRMDAVPVYPRPFRAGKQKVLVIAIKPERSFELDAERRRVGGLSLTLSVVQFQIKSIFRRESVAQSCQLFRGGAPRL
jgi:hypothetical protein